MSKKPARRRAYRGAGTRGGRRSDSLVARAVSSASRQGDAYAGLVGDIAALLETARRTSARAVNAIMTATYWEVGRRIVEYEQHGRARAEYGEWAAQRILQTPSEQSALAPIGSPADGISATLLRKSSVRRAEEGRATALRRLGASFPLPWSAYVRLLAVKNEHARRFYEVEALRGGWSVRQLDRQIDSQFYERTALSRNKAAMLRNGARARGEDAVTPEEEVKDPYILVTSALSAGRSACAWAMPGTAWICSSFTVISAAWS